MLAKPKFLTLPWPECLVNSVRFRYLCAAGYSLISNENGIATMRLDFPAGLSVAPTQASMFWSRVFG
jgi:hypothetical protein